MRVIDTSAWIEWLENSEIGRAIDDQMPERDEIVVPTIVQLELASWLTRERSEAAADLAIAFTEKCVVAPLDTRLALNAASVRKQRRLSTADAIIYATMLAHNADLLTCDAHFKDLPGVIYFDKTGA